uniref:(California timema) hypothetical protein n=1 Tax=Timema californicum TaxID=61474 RepID=A0A7R9P8F2_TIMCA|nr:unnamed protein product [Timema californicum]
MEANISKCSSSGFRKSGIYPINREEVYKSMSSSSVVPIKSSTAYCKQSSFQNSTTECMPTMLLTHLLVLTTLHTNMGLVHNIPDMNQSSVLPAKPWYNTDDGFINPDRLRLKDIGGGLIGSSVYRFSQGDSILSPSDGKGLQYCRNPAKCEQLNYTTCMGVKLPYMSTTRQLIDYALTQEQIQVIIRVYTSRRGVAGLVRPIVDDEILEWVVCRLTPSPSWNFSLPLSSGQKSTLLDAVVPVPWTRPGPPSLEKLELWRGARRIPKCWAVIQPILCALYMPKCENDTVDLPSQEMCKIALGPCRILQGTTSWLSFLKCEDSARFPPMCKNDVREVKFNTSGQCEAPLVITDSSTAFYDGAEGCGVQCQDPLFTDDDTRQIHLLVAWAGTVCACFNLFTVVGDSCTRVTFLIDWRSANKYPALVIFYMNGCFLLSCAGWLAQFLPGAREDIVCRKDHTLRMSEPSAGENLSCVVVFVLVYYFIVAAMVWFVILTYTWHLSFQALGKIQDKMDKKGAYFHLVAWSLPLILTITTMALGEIDGNSVVGICFVGYRNQAARAGLLLGPLAAMVLVGGYFLSRAWSCDEQKGSDMWGRARRGAAVSQRKLGGRREGWIRSKKVNTSVVVTSLIPKRRGDQCEAEAISPLLVILTLVSLKITSEEIISEQASAKIRETIMRIGFFSLLMLVFVLTTFVCHVYEFQHRHEWWASFRSYIMRIKNQPEEPVRLKKHRLIAQAFAKRKTFNNAGRVSISFHSTHDDPVGLNFDVNSVASQDLSSTWAAALPKLMTRRGALIGPTGSVSSHSEISLSVRRVSVESRRHSLDSQVSVQIAEVTATRKTAATPVPSLGSVRSTRFRTKRRRREFGRHRSAKVAPGPTSNKSSSISQENQLGAQILTALAIGHANIQHSAFVPNLKRRVANAGLDGKRPNLVSALPGQSLDISEEEENSKIFARRLSVIMSGHGESLELKDILGDVKLYNTDESEEDPDIQISNTSSFCPELTRLAVQSSHSVVSHHTSMDNNKNCSESTRLQHSSCDVGVQVDTCDLDIHTPTSTKGKEVKLQTSSKILCPVGRQTPGSVNDSGVEAHGANIIMVSPFQKGVLSQSVQVSQPFSAGKQCTSMHGMNYSYNALRSELQSNHPLRPQRRKESTLSKSADLARSRTAIV